MEEVRGTSGLYNASVQPQQDRLYEPLFISPNLIVSQNNGLIIYGRDTIFDRTQLLNAAKEKKPWNMTLAEKERVKT